MAKTVKHFLTAYSFAHKIGKLNVRNQPPYFKAHPETPMTTKFGRPD